MKIALAALAVFITSSISQAKSLKVVEHFVTEAETAWFLASVYYGSGKAFPKLLSANNLKRPDEIKEGMKIRIEDPIYSEDQKGFSERYRQLWQARQKALGLTAGSKLPNSEIRLPAETIRNRDRTPSFPSMNQQQESTQSATEAGH